MFRQIQLSHQQPGETAADSECQFFANSVRAGFQFGILLLMDDSDLSGNELNRCLALGQLQCSLQRKFKRIIVVFQMLDKIGTAVSGVGDE